MTAARVRATASPIWRFSTSVARAETELRELWAVETAEMSSLMSGVSASLVLGELSIDTFQ